MKSSLDKLNLRPNEKRLLVITAVVIFLVLNIWFVWPHFNDWSAIQNRTGQTTKTLKTYQDEIAKIPSYEKKLEVLRSTGSEVLSEELQLQRIVQNLAVARKVSITRYDPRPRANLMRTNQFFEDQVLSIEFNAGPEELVGFLTELASGNSMIRVREMALKPDVSQTKLQGSLVFIASYQKKTNATTRATAPARRPNT